ncbi:mitochondrial import inner membrane translocase subunit tim54 [Thoreauomyces humboldtii]|nr:mitochondrial import inner membrane translocase subunit tim54 [Thoreauomyces humboldtii]
MSLAAAIRKRMPSRNWSIFLGGSSILGGLAAYDKYHLDAVRTDLQNRASVLANEVMLPRDTARKIRVYVAPTHWSRYWFKQYIKPVFDAAALDYDVVEPKVAGLVRDQVRELIWTAKDESRRPPAPYNPMLGPQTFLARPKYDPSEGLVAVGPNAWREVLRGLNEGCMAERPPPAPPSLADPSVPDEGADALMKDTAKKEGGVHAQPEPPLDMMDSNVPRFPLPCVGFITGRQQAGWTGFPKRIYGWFTERDTAREIGEEALLIAFSRVRDYHAEDAGKGAEDIYVHEDWDDIHKDIVRDVTLSESVAHKLFVYQ